LGLQNIQKSRKDSIYNEIKAIAAGFVARRRRGWFLVPPNTYF
jgi:hypothetical protein